MAGLSGANSGDAGAIEAGRAYVKFSVKDDTAGDLKRLQAKLAEVGKTAAKTVGGETGSVFEKAGKGGFGALATVGAVSALREMARHADAFAPALTAARRELELIEGAAKAANFSMGRLTDDFERARSLTTGQKNLDLLNRQIKAQEQLLKDQDAARTRASEVARGIGDRGVGTIFLRDQLLGGDTQAEYRAALAAADKLGGARAEMDKKLAELRREREQMIDPFKSGEFLASFNGLGAQIKDALDPAIAGMGELERKAFDLARANALAGDEARRRLEAVRDEARAADAAIRDRALDKDFDEIQRDMRRANPGLRKLGEWETRLRGFYDRAGIEMPAEIRMQAKGLDEKLEQADVQQDFIRELSGAKLRSFASDLSAGDQQLAAMVQRGFSNDQIMKLRAVQQELLKEQEPGTMTAGGLASAGLAQSLGVANQWQVMAESAELTVKRLDEIRGKLGEIEKQFGFR